MHLDYRRGFRFLVLNLVIESNVKLQFCCSNMAVTGELGIQVGAYFKRETSTAVLFWI